MKAQKNNLLEFENTAGRMLHAPIPPVCCDTQAFIIFPLSK